MRRRVRERWHSSRVLLLAAAALSQPARSHPADAEEQLIDEIRDAEAQRGAYSVELLDPLTNLGLLYQESGDYPLAAATLERARQVVRANYGLSSLDQAPLLRQQIDSEEARGDFRKAWDLEQQLVELAKAHPEDLRTVPILQRIGDRRREILARYLAGDRPPQLAMGCFSAPWIISRPARQRF